MRKLTATNLVRAIAALDRNVDYNYVSSKTKSKIRITRIEEPEGPIWIKRYNPNKQQSAVKAKEAPISSAMLWRVANATMQNLPLNLDRMLAGSYNTRSVLEALLVHTPEFYYCYPGRIAQTGSQTSVKPGHKHLIWLPDSPHQLGILAKAATEIVVSELPTTAAVYDALDIGSTSAELDIDTKRRHVQMQIALIAIGQELSFRTWVALGDQGIKYKDKRLGDMDGVVDRLSDLPQVQSYPSAIEAAKFIDVIWFKNGKLMPAAIEIEHSTGVTSGLTRMKGLQDALPPYPIRYVVVAADDDRQRVVDQANREQFRSLQTRYFSYSAVEELYSLCQRRKLKGVTEEFLDSFMEPVVQ